MTLKQWMDNGWLRGHKTTKEEIVKIGDPLTKLTSGKQINGCPLYCIEMASILIGLVVSSYVHLGPRQRGCYAESSHSS